MGEQYMYYGPYWIHVCASLLEMPILTYQVGLEVQGTKIFQYCTCPAGQVTYNFHSSCKHMHLSFKSEMQ